MKLASCKSALTPLTPYLPPPPPRVPRWFTLLTFLRRWCGPGVSLTLCCFVVYSMRRFVFCLTCVILFLCFSVLSALRLPRLGKRELILVLFVRLFDLCLFRFVGVLILLVSGKGCDLWLWHSLDFSLTFFLNKFNRRKEKNTDLFHPVKKLSLLSCTQLGLSARGT